MKCFFISYEFFLFCQFEAEYDASSNIRKPSFVGIDVRQYVNRALNSPCNYFHGYFLIWFIWIAEVWGDDIMFTYSEIVLQCMVLC